MMAVVGRHCALQITIQYTVSQSLIQPVKEMGIIIKGKIIVIIIMSSEGPPPAAQRASIDAQRAPYELRESLRRSVNPFRGHQSVC